MLLLSAEYPSQFPRAQGDIQSPCFVLNTKYIQLLSEMTNLQDMFTLKKLRTWLKFIYINYIAYCYQLGIIFEQ